VLADVRLDVGVMRGVDVAVELDSGMDVYVERG